MFVHFQRHGRSRMVLHTVFRWWQRDRAGLREVYSQLSPWEKSQPWEAKIGERKIKIWLTEAAQLKEGKNNPANQPTPHPPIRSP